MAQIELGPSVVSHAVGNLSGVIRCITMPRVLAISETRNISRKDAKAAKIGE